jgi:hypothetical protein
MKRYQGFTGGPRGVINIIGQSGGLVDYLAQSPGQPPLPEGITAQTAIQVREIWAAACGGYHIGSLQELPHTRLDPMVPLLVTFYEPR